MEMTLNFETASEFGATTAVMRQETNYEQRSSRR